MCWFQRDNTVRSFMEGKVWVLVCTELMGRGIDFKGINLVINYDFPTTAVSYIRRIGELTDKGNKNPGARVKEVPQEISFRMIRQDIRVLDG